MNLCREAFILYNILSFYLKSCLTESREIFTILTTNLFVHVYIHLYVYFFFIFSFTSIYTFSCVSRFFRSTVADFVACITAVLSSRVPVKSVRIYVS